MLLASAFYNNGNATTDGLKNLQTTYNILNLPQKVSQSGTTKATYTWFADGSKYTALDNAGNGICYIGSLIYNTSANATTTLESTDFSQGRIALNNNTQTIHYHHRDHLGSVRAITNGNGTVIEQNSYYPFGGRHNFGISNTPAANNRYKFNGKEEQTIGGLNLLDYGARMYDTKTARWLVQDPLAEKYYSFSAYNYCVNNPVMFVDPDGRKPGDYYSNDGNLIGYDGTDDGKIYLLNEYVSVESDFSKILSAQEIDYLIQNSIEVEALIIQTRIAEGEDYTISRFITVGGKSNVLGYTLEPAGPSTIIPDQDLRIPEGVYNIGAHSTKKYPDHFVIYNENVPKDRGILYHIGNDGTDTEGCVLPGTYVNNNGTIGGSTKKFNELKKFLKTTSLSNIRLIINENL